MNTNICLDYKWTPPPPPPHPPLPQKTKSGIMTSDVYSFALHNPVLRCMPEDMAAASGKYGLCDKHGLWGPWQTCPLGILGFDPSHTQIC